MRLFITDESRLKGLRIVTVGMLIGFAGVLLVFIADAYNIGRVLTFLGWVVGIVGLIWHFVILLSDKRTKKNSSD